MYLTSIRNCICNNAVYIRSANKSFKSGQTSQSRNCLCYPSALLVSIISSGQKSACCCQQFYFLFVTIHVWCSTGLTPVQCLLYTTPFQTPYSVTRSTISFLLTKISFKINYQMTYKALQATPPNDVQRLTGSLQSYTDGIKSCTCSNQLKHNEDKTETILFSTSSLSSFHCLLS